MWHGDCDGVGVGFGGSIPHYIPHYTLYKDTAIDV